MNQEKKITGKIAVKDRVVVGMFAALLAVSAQISIPLPGMSLTLQTFAAALCGMFLGWKYGVMSVLVYLLIGAFGMPVFSGMRGGPGMLFGRSGGFLFGFLFLAGLCGIGRRRKNRMAAVGISLLGLALCHILGIMQFGLVAHMPLAESAVLVSAPFLIKDIVSVILAYFAADLLKRRLPANRP